MTHEARLRNAAASYEKKAAADEAQSEREVSAGRLAVSVSLMASAEKHRNASAACLAGADALRREDRLDEALLYVSAELRHVIGTQALSVGLAHKIGSLIRRCEQETTPGCAPQETGEPR